jgi:hypothetical protein
MKGIKKGNVITEMAVMGDCKHQFHLQELRSFPAIGFENLSDGEVEFEIKKLPSGQWTNDENIVFDIVAIPVKPVDGWQYDYKFLKDLTYKVNQTEHGDGLSMEEVESVLLSINYSH